MTTNRKFNSRQKERLKHVEHLQHELLHERQSVAEHLLRSRTLEKTLLQYQASEAAIRNLTQNQSVSAATSFSRPLTSLTPRRPGTSGGTDTNVHVPYQLGSKNAILPESWLKEIERICDLKQGYSFSLCHLYANYNDDSMQEEILQLTNSVAFQITVDVFTKVCIACSRGKVSSYDAMELFMHGESIIEKLNRQDRHTHWQLLVHLLRKHLLILHIAFGFEKLQSSHTPALFLKPKSTPQSSVHRGELQGAQEINSGLGNKHLLKEVRTAKRSTVVKSGKKPSKNRFLGDSNNNSNNHNSNMLSRSLSSTISLGSTTASIEEFTSSQKLDYSFAVGGSTTAINSSNNGNSNSNTIGQRANSLTDSLSQSQAIQMELSNKILGNMTLISRTVGLDGTKYKSAVEFSRRMGARKMESVLQSVVKRELIEAVSRWRRVSHFQRTIQTVKLFHKHVCCGRLYFAIKYNLQRKLASVFQRWCDSNNWLDCHEVLAAVIEIQRVWRGALSRYRFLQTIREMAATMIQSIVRGHHGRLLMREMRYQLQLKAAVRRIEDAWIRLRWTRLIQRRIKAQKMEIMCRVVQRVYRGYRVRKQYRKILWERKQQRCCTRIQNVWRQFVAIHVVIRLRLIRLQFESARHIQRVVRGRLGRIIHARTKYVHEMILRLQYSWLCYRARCERYRLYRIRCATAIQSVIRMKLAKINVHILRDEALYKHMLRVRSIRYLERFVLGYRARRKYLKVLFEFKQARSLAAVVLQARIQALLLGYIARQHVKRLRIDMSEAAVENRRLEHERKIAEAAEIVRLAKWEIAAVCIQRVVRGILGRTRAKLQRKECERRARYAAVNKDRIPLYWRLQQDYYKHQNFYHKPFIIRIQSAMRRKLAQLYIKQFRFAGAANTIKNNLASYHRVTVAKKELAHRKKVHRRRLAGVVALQRIGRGYLARLLILRRKMAAVLLWFLQERRARNNTKRALENFRLQRRAAILFQAMIRRRIARVFYIKNHKRLVKERNKRIRLRRQRAAILLQGLARIIHAKRIMHRKRKELQEELERRAVEDTLDANIEGIHAGWMEDLLAIRTQSGTRGFMGRQQAKKKKLSAAEEAAERIRLKKYNAAVKIQALARGVAARQYYKRIRPYLRQQQRARQFCVECESKVATKRCRVCKDNYCDACFVIVHKRGTRTRHDWEPVRTMDATGKDDWQGNGTPTNAEATRKQKQQQQQHGSSNKMQAAGAAAAAAPVPNSRADWEQFYDQNAKAKYWFNSKTGEASWTTPAFS